MSFRKGFRREGLALAVGYVSDGLAATSLLPPPPLSYEAEKAVKHLSSRRELRGLLEGFPARVPVRAHFVSPQLDARM